MRIASVADVKACLSAYLKETEEGPVIVTRNGKAVAVLLAVTDDDELERLVLAHSPKFKALSTSPGARSKRRMGVPTTFSGARWKRRAVQAPASRTTEVATKVRGCPLAEPHADRSGLPNRSLIGASRRLENAIALKMVKAPFISRGSLLRCGETLQQSV